MAELLKNPRLMDELTLPQLNAFNQELQLLVQMARNKRDLPTNPAEFAAKYSAALPGDRFATPPHIMLISKRLSELHSHEYPFHMAIGAPPRHGKTKLIGQWYPVWYLAKNPSHKVIYVSNQADQAVRYGGRPARTIVVDTGRSVGLKLSEDSTSAAHWDLVTGGGMESIGVGGSIAGKGAHLFILDDPIKDAEQAKSKKFREDMWEWFLSVCVARLEPGGKIVILSTRWHQDDLIGRVMDRQVKGAEGLRFESLMLPAIALPEDELGRNPSEPLWPERFPLAKLEEIRSTYPPWMWEALYQQNPTPEEGNAVKRVWWQYYTLQPSTYDIVIQSWDLTFGSGLKTADYCVGLVLGRKGSSIYVIDMLRERMDTPEQLQAIKNMSMRYPMAGAKIVEKAAGGWAAVALLQKEVPGLLALPPRLQGTGTQSAKELRLQQILPFIQAGNLFLPQGAKWVPELIEECAQFPDSAHDDIVDALSQGVSFLMFGAYASKEAAAKAALEAQPPKTIKEIYERQFQGHFAKVMAKEERRFKLLNQRGHKDRTWPTEDPLDFLV
jgi:predicted phage terminase large subunit-like protein